MESFATMVNRFGAKLSILRCSRNSRPEEFCKKGVLKPNKTGLFEGSPSNISITLQNC